VILPSWGNLLSWRGLALGLLALVQSACSAEATPASPASPVVVDRIERTVIATGTIEPERDVELRSRVAGIVEGIYVKPGMRVAQGQLLVELDRELTAVEARGARSELQSSEVDLEQAQRELERVARLKKQRATTERMVEEARAARDVARAKVARMQATVDQLEVQLRYTSVRAPISGKILEVLVEEGSAVSALTSVSGGTVLMRLAQEDPLHLRGLVDENQVADVRIGQEGRIITEAFRGRTFLGRVRNIAPIGERRENVTYFEVEVELLEGSMELRPKMSADAEIVTETIDQALLIPETALIYEGERVFVDALKNPEDNSPERRAVELGIAADGRIQIVAGLSPGEFVRLQ